MMIGIGAMLHYLGGGSEHSSDEYTGATIKEASIGDERLHLVFEDGRAIDIWDNGQSCCESRYMTTDDEEARYPRARLEAAIRKALGERAPPLPAEVEKTASTLRWLSGDDSGKFTEGDKSVLLRAASLLSRWPGVWRPIETAPKDGTEILIGRKGERTRLVVTYEKDNDSGFPWALMADSSVNFEASWPTHWSPLPEPPHE